MKRRDFLIFLGGAATAGPVAAYAQQPALPLIGFLGSRSAETDAHLMTWFRGGLAESGHLEGKNVTIAPAATQPASTLWSRHWDRNGSNSCAS